MAALARPLLLTHKSRHVILLWIRQISPIISFRVVLHLREYLLSKSKLALSSRNRKTKRGRVYSLIMDVFLSKVTQQAMNYAIRSGITITATYAIRQSSRLLKNVEGTDHTELQDLQSRLGDKIRIISPAIDLIELIAARGNTSLESAVALTKALRWDIQDLGQRLATAASAEELSRRGTLPSRDPAHTDADIKHIIKDIKRLLVRIEEAVPFINLAITTSGATLSTTLPSTVSPSRLLQASTFLTAGDTQYSMLLSDAVQVGPTFTLSVYMLFSGHIRPHDEQSARNTTWKEVIHKAKVKLRRVPMNMVFSSSANSKYEPAIPQDTHIRAEARADEFAYQILIIEDLDDGRVHTFEDEEQKPESYEDVALAGIREVIPIHEISKIFYADTGKILNIGTEGEPNNPVLLLKRDVNAIPPRRMMGQQESLYGDEFEETEEAEEEAERSRHRSAEDDVQAQLDSQLVGAQPISPTEHADGSGSMSDKWRFPPGLDPEWIAFEVYNESDDYESETEPEPSPPPGRDNRAQTAEPQLTEQLSNLALNGGHKSATPSPKYTRQISTISNPLFNNIRTSLSLLETLLRLTSLQQFQQQSHLSITDELLNFFLEESSATGAGGDEQHRQRVRAEARRKVGWDPYDESPLKPRGEDYQYRAREQDWAAQSPRAWHGGGGDYSDYPPTGTPSQRSPDRSDAAGYPISPRNYEERRTPSSQRYTSLRSPSGRDTFSPEPPLSPSLRAHQQHPVNLRTAALRGHGSSSTHQQQRRRESSPLVQPRTGTTDEGIGTSPSAPPGK
ncbi:hypothetical protein AJ80_00521 [Polytolypa hystricis UAMH7299]|uniref:Ran-binding-domain-containing protein n=1 Tax=Polytolypa hystricis (strain UAMH7299) TaxID=1447883 RepID=A0A2B7YUJ2_POLH7|nr:hypothetical protein AJ80_00521 [Polytolypa hystricis UAMH7299]